MKLLAAIVMALCISTVVTRPDLPQDIQDCFPSMKAAYLVYFKCIDADASTNQNQQGSTDHYKGFLECGKTLGASRRFAECNNKILKLSAQQTVEVTNIMHEWRTEYQNQKSKNVQ